MNKLKAFAYSYKQSLTSPTYYKDVISTPGWFSFKYFLFLSFLLSIVLSIGISIKLIPQVKDFIQKGAVTAKGMYENDLVIKSDKNVWSINKAEPYSIPIPATSGAQDEKTPKNIITFWHNGTIDDLKKLDTFILVNTKNVLTQDSNSFRVYPIQNAPDGELTKEIFSAFVDQLVVTSRALPYFVVFFVFVFSFLGLFLIKGSNLFLVGFFVWLLAKVIGFEVNYNGATKMAAHASTLALTLMVVLKVLNINYGGIFWVEAVTLVFCGLVLMKLKRDRGDSNNTIVS